MLRIGHQEHGLYVRLHGLVHAHHLEFILEIRHSPQPPHDNPGADIAGESRVGPHQAAASDVGDVGALAAFLVSDAAKLITGTIIPVDGGLMARNS